MKLLDTKDFIKQKNPIAGSICRLDILSEKDKARNLGGIFGLLPPGIQVPYHYHRNRESIIIGINGEATLIVEDKEIPINATKIVFIPPSERHKLVNGSDRDFRFLEFFTYPPVARDFIEM